MVFAAALQLMPVRRAQAEDHADFKFLWYREESRRVTVWGPSFLVEKEISPRLNLKIEGIYDIISGASPTGAPTPAQIRVGSAGRTFSVVSGASSRSSGEVPGGDHVLPTQTFSDKRFGLNGELTFRDGDWSYGGQIAYSKESDYAAIAATAKIAREFNNKNTVISAGVSVNHDDVNPVNSVPSGSKDGVQLFLGATQVLDPKTVLSVNFTAGFSSGYLSDPYKVAWVAGSLLADKRPRDKDNQILYTSLTRAVDSLNGSAEVSYRYYRDSFGVNAHTAALAWYQKIGSTLVVKPSVRYYQQDSANFYGVMFLNTPEYYSADYRLSSCSSLTYGVKVVWTPRENFSVDVAYDRYDMRGRDGVTAADAYPKANIVTVGFRYSF